MEAVRVENDTISVSFNRWTLDEYHLFLKTKKLPEFHLTYNWKNDAYMLSTSARFAHILGIGGVTQDHGWLPLSDFLLDYQRFIVSQALRIKRYAIWSYTGSGKTPMYLEWARQVSHRTGGKVLLIVPLNIIRQTIDMARMFYGDGMTIEQIDTRDNLKVWCVDGKPTTGIVNPDKFIPHKDEPEVISEIRHCAGVVLDEASLLKTGGGKIKWALIKSCRGIEYKLACTATPAPNDTMEYASQGSFLEKLRDEGEILWTFFKRDKDGNWKVKQHAEAAFYRFMAGWSIYLNDPKNYGFQNHLKDLPEPMITEYPIDTTPEQQAYLLRADENGKQSRLFVDRKRLTMPKRIELSEVAKGFVYSKDGTTRIPSLKPSFVADLVKKDVVHHELQVLVWTIFDEESTIIAEELKDAPFTIEMLTGKMKEKDRVEIIERFRSGETDVLVSKASLLGFGLNFQNCGSMVYSGFNDSFEEHYQSIRRAVRYGQTKQVRIHIPYIPELEGVIWDNVKAKQERFLQGIAMQEAAYIEAMKGELNVL